MIWLQKSCDTQNNVTKSTYTVGFSLLFRNIYVNYEKTEEKNKKGGKNKHLKKKEEKGNWLEHHKIHNDLAFLVISFSTFQSIFNSNGIQ